MDSSHQFVVDASAAQALGKSLRGWLQLSWSEARQLLLRRHVAVNSVLCMDEARRLTVGEKVQVHKRPLPPPPSDNDIVIHHVDHDIIVVEKPARMLTLRPAAERQWTARRRELQPTLDEVLIRRFPRSRGKGDKFDIYAVHRIDRDTSGLLVFARHYRANDEIARQFAQHSVHRSYHAVIAGTIRDQTVESYLVRDRGDGVRGTSADPQNGQRAVTHLKVKERWGEYSELNCRLETGRTNQIRIHLAEMGFPICGDLKYRGPMGVPPIVDHSGAPRLALHAAELGFIHPRTKESMKFSTPWPPDMHAFLDRLRRAGASHE